MSYLSDIKFGFKNEKDTIDIIRLYFQDNIQKMKRYDKYDFMGECCYYELKSRRNKYRDYPTTLIPADKIDDTKNIIFIFNFTDGLYYIKYNKEIFDTFEKKPFKRHQRVGYNDKQKDYYFIPIEALNYISI
jgi:hypothetical protein